MKNTQSIVVGILMGLVTAVAADTAQACTVESDKDSSYQNVGMTYSDVERLLKRKKYKLVPRNQDAIYKLEMSTVLNSTFPAVDFIAYVVLTDKKTGKVVFARKSDPILIGIESWAKKQLKRELPRCPLHF